MLMRIVRAVIVAVVVFLGCILLGMLLSAIGVSIAGVVGAFITKYATAISIIAGIWYFATKG